MALTADEHLRRAKYNEDFARWLGIGKSKWPSWTVTALFYAGVHQVQALLVTHDLSAEKHGERFGALVNWPDVRIPYARLYQLSIEARYQGKDHSEARREHALALLDDIKREVARATGVEAAEK